FLLYCRLRLFELAAQRAGQIAHSLQSHAVAAHDAMVDLQRELSHLAEQFPISDSAESAPLPGAPAEIAAVRSSVVQELKAAEEVLTKQLDEQLTQAVFANQGGLRAVVTAGGEGRQNLVATIRTGARQAVLAKLESIDLTSLLLAGKEGESPLTKC